MQNTLPLIFIPLNNKSASSCLTHYKKPSKHYVKWAKVAGYSAATLKGYGKDVERPKPFPKDKFVR